MTDLSVVIVTWNVRELLQGCLDSLIGTITGLEYEIIIVDNGSKDGTVELISRQYPQVKLISNRRNTGFPRANNLAINKAKGEFVLLLNPDTIVLSSTIEQCVDYIRTHASIGVLGCKVLYPDGEIQYECARNFPNLFTMVLQTFYLHLLFPRSKVFGRYLMGYWNHKTSREVPCVMGAFMLLKREALDEVGFLNEHFFMYYEDVDLCARMWEHGWKVCYLSTVAIVHKSGASRKKSKSRFDLLEAEITWTFFKEHRSLFHALLCRLVYLMRGSIRFLMAAATYPILRWLPNLRERPAFNLQLHIAQILWALGLRSYTEVVNSEALGE